MTKTEIILKKLRHSALTTGELIESCMPSYQETYKTMQRKMRGDIAPLRLSDAQQKRLQEKSFFSLLSRLKRQGLVEKQKLGSISHWKTTPKGLQKIKNGVKILKTAFFPKRSYPLDKDCALTIVLFDIPEKFKLKRTWLRNNLKNLEFRMLQKSAWIGESKVPEEFIFDMEQLEILEYVHILKVQKKGSLINW